MTPKQTTRLPVIPLIKNTVLLPGIVLRIPVPVTRIDIRALLPNIQRLDSINIVCVPLNSPYLTKIGQKTIKDLKDTEIKVLQERLDVNPASATKDDLFGYGVAARIRGVEGKGSGEFALLVEGVCRVSIDKIVSERPFFEAEVTYKYDDGTLDTTPNSKFKVELLTYTNF